MVRSDHHVMGARFVIIIILIVPDNEVSPAVGRTPRVSFTASDMDIHSFEVHVVPVRGNTGQGALQFGNTALILRYGRLLVGDLLFKGFYPLQQLGQGHPGIGVIRLQYQSDEHTGCQQTNDHAP